MYPWSRPVTLLLMLFCMQGLSFAQVAEKPTVYVSILPQKFLVDRIGGGNFQVSVMVGPGESPATYELKPRQMAGLKTALLYYRVGVPFEDVWLPKVLSINPQLPLLDAREGLELREMEPAGGHHHDYDATHHHGKGADPHIWMSPRLYSEMARNLARRLGELDPQHADLYRDNYQQLATELDHVNTQIHARLEKLQHRRFMVFHPSWGYFADEYHLQQIPIEAEGKQPGARTLARLIGQAKEEGIKVIFIQKQFDHSQAESIAQEISGRVLAIDPLAEDYLDNLNRIVDAITGESGG